MAKYNALGTTIGVDMSGGTTFVTIGQVRDISGPSLGRDTVETTTRDSSNAWREFIKGLKNAGEVTFEVVFDPDLSSHSYATGILSDFASESTLAKWRISFPDTTPTTFTFGGIVTTFETSMPMEDALTASVTIKVTGAVTVA